VNKSSAVAEMADGLATTDMGQKVGGGAVPLSVGGAGSPSNTMWPGPRPTSIPSFILIPLTGLATIHERHRQDRQTTVPWHRANCFTNGRPKKRIRSRQCQIIQCTQ